MANIKITQLPTATTIGDNDLIPVVTGIGGTPVTEHITKYDFAATLGSSPISTNPVENTYSDIASMLADQSNQTTNYFNYVVDASSDPNVLSGEAYYEKLTASTTTLSTDYRLLSDTEVTVVKDSNSYRVFRIEAIQDEGTPLTSVSGGKVSFEYSGANVTAILFNKRYTDAIAEFYGKDVSIRFHNRAANKYETEAVASTAWTTVNTDYYRAEVTGTNIQIADLTVNNRCEFFIVEAAAGGGGSSTVTESTGTTITFTEDTFWNNLTYLTSGNLTLDLTGAVVGTASWVWCDRYIPTISGENFLISGTPSTSKLNIYKMVYTGAQTDDYDIDVVVDNKVYLNTPTITLTEDIADEITLSNYSVGGADTYSILFNEVEQTYATLAAMFADQAGQTSGLVQYVTAEETYYEYDGTTVGDITDYTTISSTEIGTAATVTTPAYNGTDLTYTHTGRTVGDRFIYFVSCSGDGYLDSLYGIAEGTSAAGFTFTATAGDNFFQLPLVSGGSYNFTIYVDNVEGDTITVWNDANTDIDLGDTSSHTIELRGEVTGWSFAGAGDKDKIYDISNWGSLKLGVGDDSVNSFFDGCSNLTISATDVLDLNTTSMLQAFYNCDSITTIPNIHLWTGWSSVTSMQQFLAECANANPDLESINVSNVTNFTSTFQNADSFAGSLSNWNVGNGTNFSSMFRLGALNNPDVTNWDMSSATTLTFMLSSTGLTTQSLANWDVTAVTTAANFLNGETLDTSDMDATIISWAAQAVNSSVNFHLGNGTVTGTVADSGTTDGATTTNKLIDSTQNFTVTVAVGDAVYNSTDTTYALVTNVVSDTELALNSDIMATGEAYTIYNNDAAKAICKLASTYSWTITFGGFV